MLAITFALVALFGWGIGDIFTTIAVRKIGTYNSSLYGYITGVLLFSAYLPVALSEKISFSLEMMFLTALLTAIQLIAFISFLEALRVGNSSLVGTIGGAFTSLVVIFSLIFLGERLSLFQAISVVVIFVGLILSTTNISDVRKNTIVNKGTMLAVIAMIGWGIYFTFIKIPVKEAGFFWPTFLSEVIGMLALCIFRLGEIRKFDVKPGTGFVAAIVSGVLTTIALYSFNFGIGRGLSSVVAPISGAYPALFALFSYYVFRDPISRQHKIGMVIALIRIVFLASVTR